MRKTFSTAVLVAALAAGPGLTQTYPDRPITMIVPFAAGSGTDAAARIYAQAMGNELGQPVVVENKPGAAASLGSALTAQAKPDGYTIQIGGTTSHSAVRSLLKDVPYDPVADFDAIVGMAAFPYYLLVRSDSGLDSVQGLIDHGNANPGKLAYGHGNALGRLTGGVFNTRAGFDATEIPYPSTPPAIQDLLGGNIDFMFTDATVMMPHLTAGTVKALATASPARSALMPDVPTLQESGLESFTLVAWNGLFAPKGIPQEASDRLRAAVIRINADPEMRERMANMGAEVIQDHDTPLSEVLAADVARWQEYAAIVGITPQ